MDSSSSSSFFTTLSSRFSLSGDGRELGSGLEEAVESALGTGLGSDLEDVDESVLGSFVSG